MMTREGAQAAQSLAREQGWLAFLPSSDTSTHWVSRLALGTWDAGAHQRLSSHLLRAFPFCGYAVAEDTHKPQNEASALSRERPGVGKKRTQVGCQGLWVTCPPVQEDDVHEKTSDGPEKRVQAEGEKDQGLEGKPLGTHSPGGRGGSA